MNPTQQKQQTADHVDGENQQLYITNVEAFGPYLKIYGQLNRNAITAMCAKMEQVVPNCFVVDASNWQLTQQQILLQSDTWCIYKLVRDGTSADCELVRARVVHAVGGGGSASHIMQVEVELIDYGYNAVVASNENPDQMLKSIPTLCSEYIALGVCKDWKKTDVDEILRIIKHQTLEICIQMEFNQFKFITMKWKEFNFAQFLVHQRKIGAAISNDLLRDNFIKMWKQQQQQLIAAHGGIYNNNNCYANKNISHNISNNGPNKNNNMRPSVAVGNNYDSLATTVGEVADRGSNQICEQMAARFTLAARLQQHQQQQQQHQIALQMQQNHLMPIVQPRMQPAIGNLRSMMQGRHLQCVPYSNPRNRGLVSVANGYLGVMPLVNTFNNTRFQYQMTPAPQHLGIDDGTILKSSLGSQPRRSLATFKSNSLTVGHIYDVCVSFVENGPCLFSVQLSTDQNAINDMMNRIERVQLIEFIEKPVLGTACIARYSEDGQLYRALITGVQATACKVAYIDYGNAELVKFRDLYVIPDEFLQAKAYAIRFTLSGHKELEPIDESLKKAFKDLVSYKNFKLKVMPLEGPPLVQYCELYSKENNILDVLRQIQKCRLVYAKAEPLINNDVVEIRYIDSPKHFYVQKVSNISDFEELMDDMYLYYNKNQNVPNQLALGAPCIVKYDKEWYRAEVMRADAAVIVVRHVDFGYEQKVTKNLLSTIAEKHLKLPRQAVQCCLKGFENNELTKDLATTQFEMLAEESNRQRRSFTVKVFRIQPDGVNLVNLCTKELNVMKKLYKLSLPFEQYLTLEKEEFNMYSGNHQRNAVGGENGHKTPSIDSSSDAPSMHSSKKGSFLNSTPLQSKEHMQTLKLNSQAQQHHQILRISNINVTNSLSTEYDINSSVCSMDNRESRSSSSEYKQGKRHQQQQHQGKNMHNVSANSLSDRHSTDSACSSNAVNGQTKPRSGLYATTGTNVSPRFQQENRNSGSRHNKQQQNVSRQQHSQRPQNAPQGYSQHQQKMAATANQSRDSHTSSNEQQQSPSQVLKQPQQQTPQSLPPQRPQTPEEFVPLDRPIPYNHFETPLREEVTICWWVSPHQFYTHPRSRSTEFESLMQEMQQFYKRKSPQHLHLKVGCHVVAYNRKDAVFYRARIVACNQMLRKYKVYFVDYGNQYTVTSEDIWQVEKRFADLPCMAHLCSFSGIVSNFDHLYIIDRMGKFLPGGATLMCEYFERTDDIYYVNVNVNKVSLKETLKKEGLITEVCPDLQLDLLAGQQIRVKICAITDMLNFKIHIENCDENVNFLCSYDDVRYVKSNPDVAQKFKIFYEGKSFLVNIKDVNENKVVLLRPLMPLLKDDIPSYVGTYPILFTTFPVRVVYIDSAYRLHVHCTDAEMKISKLLNDMYSHYENGGNPLDSFEVEQMCAAKGSDDNWYRARITGYSQNDNDSIQVYYIDYGNTETIDKNQLKQLAKEFYLNHSGYGLEINLPLRPLIEKGRTKQMHTTHEQDADAAVTKALEKLLLEHTVTVNALEVRHNHLIADILLPYEGNKNVLDVLKEKQLIKCRDVDFMRKLLDKDKPNMLEYIEMVDLTLEDEEEVLDKSKNSSKSKASPKKKNFNKTEDEKSPEKLAEQPVERPRAPNAETLKQVLNTEAVHVAFSASEEEKLLPTPTQLSIKADSKPTTPVPTPEPVVDRYADMDHAILSHCDNPAQFFVHPQEKFDELCKLQENLQIVASSLPPLMNVNNGAHCISLYSVDKQWYRAKIVDAELMVLQFIDYGNTDMVSDTTDVKEMSVFPDIEPFCIPCSLPIKPKGTADWVDAANAIFNDSYGKVLHYEYITRGDSKKRSFINLFIEGVNIADKLIQDGFAKPLEVVDSGENCYISHVNSLTDFYIQYEKDSKALELIEIYLADNKKLNKMEKFEPAKIVAALFPDDGNWYRAKLLKECPNSNYEVLFIDYGNASISPECKEISQDIATLQPLSKKCALELPKSCLAWSDAAEAKFAEIAALGETIFTVELRAPTADHAVVHLFIDGHNINDDLEILCEHRSLEELAPDCLNLSLCDTTLQSSVFEFSPLQEGVVTHVNSPNDFFVQLSIDAVPLEDMTSNLNSLDMDVLEQPQVGQLCAAVFTDDNAFYRARILEVICMESKKYRVLFIDFGNESISADLRMLPQDLQDLKEFSKHCKLEYEGKVIQLGDAVSETFNALIDGCQGLVKVEFLATESDPALVKLYAANTDENLGEKLRTLVEANAADVHAEPIPDPLAAETKPNTCIISHAISPTHFYVQLKVNSSHMEVVAKALQKANVELLPILTIAKVSQVCSVYSSEDDCYYRGRVNAVYAGDGGYEIYLLDYGNTIVSTQLRELPAEIRCIPALALKCRLNEVPEAPDALLAEVFSALLEAHFGEIYEIESDEMDTTTREHTLKLQVNYRDLAEELSKAVKSDLPPINNLAVVPELHECTVIHINSPISFFIQLSDDIAALEKITDVLLDADTDFEKFTTLRVGALCAAQFPEDSAFYRAKIVQVLEEGKCEVHYLDFGNNSVTDQFRQLPACLLNTERYSKHCALEGYFSSSKATAHFQTLIDSRFSETFQVEFLKSSEHLNICRLFYQNKNVATELMQLLKNGDSAVSADTSSGVVVKETVLNPSSGVRSTEYETNAEHGTEPIADP